MTDRMDTDQEWEKWGLLEPYFGVITNPEFRRNNLDKEAKERFFASGRDHAEHVLRVCRERIDPTFSPRRVLDFGCGVGRVTFALAGASESVVGVDVSESMLRVAEENRVERAIENVTFSASDDSLTTVEGAFDLIHSFIVFQHLEVSRARGLFLTLIERLAPRGIFIAHFTYGKANHPLSFGRAPPVVEPPQEVGPDAADCGARDATRDPVMLMNEHEMNQLLFVMQTHGVTSFFAEFTDHGGELGVLMYFQR